MIVELAVTAGPHTGRTFRFAEHATFVVGRSKTATFSLPEKDPHLSRFHALIEVNPPLCRVQHLSETNPTLLNGSAVTQADLREGDRISLGRTELVVRILATEIGGESPTVSLPASPANSSVAQATVTADPFAMPWPDSSADIRVLPVIPGYRLDAELGRGGMGVVYRAVHLASGEPVALKMILPAGTVTKTALQRFLREADVVRRLAHPGIVRFRDSGEHDGQVWFAMEYVPGANAGVLQREKALLPIGRAVGWMVQVLEGVAYAHDSGFVHRDIKPENMLISGGPGVEVVKLADFGLAKAYEASPLSGLTMTGQGGGTLAYMPPEQILDMRSVTPAADQYAAAATLVRLLTGEYLHSSAGGQQALLRRILNEDPPRLETRRADVPPKLAEAIRRATQRDPRARFADCRELAKGLKGIVG